MRRDSFSVGFVAASQTIGQSLEKLRFRCAPPCAAWGAASRLIFGAENLRQEMTAASPLYIMQEASQFLVDYLKDRFCVIPAWDAPIADLARRSRGKVEVIVWQGGHTLSSVDLDALPDLKMIAVVGAGYDGLDVRYARSRNIAITNGAGANANDVADMAVALFLSVACDVVSGDRRVRNGSWTNEYRGRVRTSLQERRVGIVGLGNIGQKIAERLSAFGCSISWWGPNAKQGVVWPRASSLVDLAEQSDTLIVAAPLTSDTANVIDRAVIDALGREGILVNVSRGGIVSESDVIAALRAGELAAAALDVFAEEPTPTSLWADTPKAVLTPHIGGYGTAALATMASLLADNVERFCKGLPLLTPIHDVA